MIQDTASPILELTELSKAFGGLKAIDDLSFKVDPGEIVAVIGPNGAGKTTLFNMIAGAFAPTHGSIRFKGMEIGGFPAHKVAALGIARTFQLLQLFSNMSVLENVMTGRHLRSRAGMMATGFRLPFARSEEKDIVASAMEKLEITGMTGDADKAPLSLPYGPQKLLEIARAMAIEPEVLLLDEPAGGISTSEIEDLSKRILKIRDTGVTILLVEHRMELVMGIADRIVVLNYGKKIAEGTPDEVQANEAVIAAYLGEDN
jgi:branched-chain amino acid transport system ATP-binding protein